MGKINPVLYERLETLIVSMGYELVGCELLPQGRQMAFRIYIDSKTGVTVEDCSLVSRQVSAMMDVEDPIQNRYLLEVSSPGIDRPLFEIKHYHQYIGRHIRVRLRLAINERKHYKGVLQRVEEEDIYLFVEELMQEVKVPFAAIEKANLIGDIHF